MRRLLATVLLASLVALAGCGGGTTTTPAPTTDGTTQATGTLPPGVTDTGVANATALLNAHADALNGTAYAFDLDATSGTGDAQSGTHFSGATDADETLLQQNTSRSTVELYASGEYAMQRQSAAGTTQYRVLQGALARQQTSAMTNVQRVVLATYLQAGNYSVTGTTTQDGTEYVELTASNVNTSFGGTENVTGFDATLLVTQDGRIGEYTATLTAAQSGTTRTTNITYRVTDVGSADPSAPDWTNTIPQVTASVSESGSALVLENTGGSALPANASLKLTTSAGSASVTLSERLAPGDTAYVTATTSDQGLNATVTRDASAAGDVDFGNAQRVVLTGTAGNVFFQLIVANQN